MLWPFAHEYTSGLGIPKDKIVWIPHGVDLSRLEELKAYDGAKEPPFTVMFLGDSRDTTAWASSWRRLKS